RVRPAGDRTPAHRLDRRLQMLPPPSARGNRFRKGEIQRIFLPDRDELPGLEAGLSAGRDPHRIHRPGGGTEQDGQAYRPGSDLELAQPGELGLLTDAGVVRARCESTGDEAEIGLPEFELPIAAPGIDPGSGERWISSATVGVPHLVVRVDDVEAIDLQARGGL